MFFLYVHQTVPIVMSLIFITIKNYVSFTFVIHVNSAILENNNSYLSQPSVDMKMKKY